MSFLFFIFQDNLNVFLKACEKEFGLSGSQLFHAGDLQDLSHRARWVLRYFISKVRDRSQTLVRGVSEKKLGLPFRPQKISGPPFLPQKSCVNPIKKHVNSIFTGKFGNFFKAPLQGSKILWVPLFASAPLTSVCERSLMHTSKGILNLPTSSLHLCSPFQQNR